MFDQTLSEWMGCAARTTLRGVVALSAGAACWGVHSASCRADEPVFIEDRVEDSVLVATRKALEEDAAAKAEDAEAEDEGLQPISQVSEFQPELADPPPADAPPTDSAPKEDTNAPADDQSAAAPPRAHRPVTRDPASAPGDVATAFAREQRRTAAAPFGGLVAGESTRDELLSLWGDPLEKRKATAGEVLRYDIEHFEQVDVLVEKGVVEMINVRLSAEEQPDRLAEKLRIDSIDPVEITDEQTGEPLGVSYPEKGLTLILAKPDESDAAAAPAAPAFVTHMVLSAPDPEAFALRADSRPLHAYGKRLADLDMAISLDEQYAHARWLRSAVYLATGQPVKAEADASVALEQSPENATYRLRWCEALAEVGRYDDAVLETRKVIDGEDTPALTKARALHLMGRLASLGDAEIADRAIGFHQLAIDQADQLATSEDRVERRTAKNLLVDAHLAVAVEVSRRSYDNKQEVVAQWIGRASGLAEEMIANEQASLELRLRVARGALEALANLKPSKDPAPWVTEARDAAQALMTASDDQLQKDKASWELGEAYFYALRVAHSRREVEDAIAYGEQAIEHLKSGAATGDVRPAAERLVGRLFFHLGATHAVHKQDHAAAVELYDSAQPLLGGDRVDSEFVVPRQLGEALVSMGVSYWGQSQQQKAVDLTERGAALMESAVDAGVLDKGALGVPYGNLATMYRSLGEPDQAAKYASLAQNARGQAPAGTRTADAQQRAARQAPGAHGVGRAGVARPAAPQRTQASRPGRITPRASIAR